MVKDMYVRQNTCIIASHCYLLLHLACSCSVAVVLFILCCCFRGLGWLGWLVALLALLAFSLIGLMGCGLDTGSSITCLFCYAFVLPSSLLLLLLQ